MMSAHALRGAAVVNSTAVSAIATASAARVDAPTVPLSPAAALERLAELAPEQALLVAEVRGGRCVRIDSEDAGIPKPVGASAQLYVLAALARGIEGGRLHWDDRLTLAARDRSPAGGALASRSDGAAIVVRDAVSLSVGQHDATAGDLLLRVVGRAAVERELRTVGMTDPERDVPFLSTKAALTLTAGDAALAPGRWSALGAAARRALVERIDAVPADPSVAAALRAEGDDVRPADEIGWFASMHDLCRAHAALRVAADRPGMEPLRGVLASDDGGAALVAPRWVRVQYVGASSPGLWCGSWLAQRADGRTFVVAAALGSSDAIDTAAAGRLAAGLWLSLATRR